MPVRLYSKNYVILISGVVFALCTMTGCKSTNTPASETANASSAEACDGAIFHHACVHTGEVVTFGQYFQSSEEKKEPIQWRILEIDEDKQALFLLSEYIIDAQPYHTKDFDITWASSSLRKWLNTTFMNQAFSQNEQLQILTTHVENPDDPSWSGAREEYNPNEFCGGRCIEVSLSEWHSIGDDTEDKIFLLSQANVVEPYQENVGWPEADEQDAVIYHANGRYYSAASSRTVPTKHALLNGFYYYKSYYPDPDMKYYDQETCEVISEECETIWWLRGDSYHWGSDVIEPHYNVAYKQSSSNEVQGIEIENEHIGVRPVMWIKYE